MPDVPPEVDDYFRSLPQARAPATFGEVWDANWNAAGLDTPFGVHAPRDQALGELKSAFQRATGQSLEDAAQAGGRSLANSDYDETAAVAGLLAGQLPDAERDQVAPFLDIDARAAKIADETEQRASAVNSRAYGLTNVGASYVASIARGLWDPTTIAGAFIGLPEGGGLAALAAKEFAVNAGFGAATHIATEPEREALGLPDRSLLGDAASAGAFGAGLGLALRGAGYAMRRAFGDETTPAPPGFKPAATVDPGLLSEAQGLEPADFDAAARFQDRETAINAQAPRQGAAGVAQAKAATDVAEAKIEQPIAPTEPLTAAPDGTPAVPGGDVPPAPAGPTVADWKDAVPFETVDEMMAAAPANQARLAEVSQGVADDVLGTEFKDPGVKSSDRVADKMERKLYPSAGYMSDIVRGGFFVQTPEHADQVIAGLRKHFDLIDEGWRTTPAGYTDRTAIVRFEDGQLGELQFWHPDLFAAKKNRGHDMYQEAQALPEGDPRLAELNDKMRALYGGVLDRLGGPWKAATGNGGSEGNLRLNSASESTLADMSRSADLTLTHSEGLPERTAQASPGRQSAGSPSQSQNLGARSINSDIEGVGAKASGEGAPGEGAAPAASPPTAKPPAEPFGLAEQRADLEREIAQAEAAGHSLSIMETDDAGVTREMGVREALRLADEFAAGARELAACIFGSGA